MSGVYLGDEDHAGSVCAPTTFTVVPTRPITSMTLTPNPLSSAYGRLVTFTARVTVAANGSAVTSGRLRFLVNGKVVVGLQNVDANGEVPYSTRRLGTGAWDVSALYEPNPQFGYATSTFQYSVAPAKTTTTLMSGTATPGHPVTVTARVTTEHGPVGGVGTVYFLVDGIGVGHSVVLSATGLASAVLTGLTTGTHQVTASYSGTGNYVTSTATLPLRVCGR